MTPAIQQSAQFACSPKQLFEMYMDSAKHTAATGSPARISRKVGGTFTAFDGKLLGRNLLIVPDRMIVQAWRSAGWKRGDQDSIVVLAFSKIADGSQVDLLHVDVPEHDHEGLTKGWRKFYWEPWEQYVAEKTRAKRKTARA